MAPSLRPTCFGAGSPLDLKDELADRQNLYKIAHQAIVAERDQARAERDFQMKAARIDDDVEAIGVRCHVDVLELP
jgi:hypothetical protein